MNQENISIIEKSAITGDVLIINQADKNDVLEEWDGRQHIRMLTTTERGLSRSRNMAIKNAVGDICLLCDDDEILIENYENVIESAFRSLPDADVIAFDVLNKETRLRPVVQKLNYFKSLKIASCQIAFRRESILKAGVWFEVFMGAGSGNGCGEENKFLLDCYRRGLQLYFYPETIAKLDSTSSTWFFGYDRTFFYQRGAATRHMMGAIPAIFYGFYYLLRKRNLYLSTLSTLTAAKELFRGVIENPIQRQIMEVKEKQSG